MKTLPRQVSMTNCTYCICIFMLCTCITDLHEKILYNKEKQYTQTSNDLQVDDVAFSSIRFTSRPLACLRLVLSPHSSSC